MSCGYFLEMAWGTPLGYIVGVEEFLETSECHSCIEKWLDERCETHVLLVAKTRELPRKGKSATVPPCLFVFIIASRLRSIIAWRKLA